MEVIPSWIFKTEPSKYDWEDLVREKRTTWDGVTNPLALRNIRALRKGDRLFLYYTEGVRELVGVAEITSGPYPDPSAGDPKRAVADIRPVRPLPRRVSLDELKDEDAFAGSDLLRLGRLSIVPLTPAQSRIILRKAGLRGR